MVGGVLAALAVLAVSTRRWWGGITIGLFAVLAGLTALSITWSIQPSDSWLEANRTFSYLLVFAGAVTLSRTVGAWWSALLGALCAATVAICVWAILTKVFPGALASDEVYARLREPFGYWNAVGLTAALGVPPTLWLGARRSGHAAINALAYPIMGILLLTVLLAYSRGSLLAVAVGCAFWFVVVPLRLRGVAVLAVGAVGALAVAVWVFAQDTLTKDGVPIDERATSGHELGVAVLVMALVLLAAGLAMGFAAARRAPSEPARKRAGATILVAPRAGPGDPRHRAGDVVQGPGRQHLQRVEVPHRSQRPDAGPQRSEPADVGRQRPGPLLGRVDQDLPGPPVAGRRGRCLQDRAAALPDRQPRGAALPRLRRPDRGRPRPLRPARELGAAARLDRRDGPHARLAAAGLRAPPAAGGRRARPGSARGLRPRARRDGDAGDRRARLRRALVRRLDVVRPRHGRHGAGRRGLGRRPRPAERARAGCADARRAAGPGRPPAVPGGARLRRAGARAARRLGGAAAAALGRLRQRGARARARPGVLRQGRRADREGRGPEPAVDRPAADPRAGREHRPAPGPRARRAGRGDPPPAVQPADLGVPVALRGRPGEQPQARAAAARSRPLPRSALADRRAGLPRRAAHAERPRPRRRRSARPRRRPSARPRSSARRARPAGR